jgi:hypothetical protein
MWQAAGWLGMTLEQLQENYNQHHPDFQEEAGGIRRTLLGRSKLAATFLGEQTALQHTPQSKLPQRFYCNH